MKNRFLKIVVLVSLFVLNFSNNGFGNSDFEICIYGATSSGVIAAYTASKMGKSVVIIASDDHNGGLSSGGLGHTAIGNKQVIGGNSRNFYRRLGKGYREDETWRFEPSAALQVFHDYLAEEDIPVIFNKRIKSVVKEGPQIRSVVLVNTYGLTFKKKNVS